MKLKPLSHKFLSASADNGTSACPMKSELESLPQSSTIISSLERESCTSKLKCSFQIGVTVAFLLLCIVLEDHAHEVLRMDYF